MSKKICDLNPNDVKTDEIDDIQRNRHNFTDGIGNISPKLAMEVAQEFGYKFASAFQFRLGGAKGML